MGEAELLEIVVKGPGPYGFRLYGGEGDPLIVAKLRARSKAHDAGLREGDIVLGINGRSCQTISHGVAMTLLESADDALHLHLYRGSTAKDALSAAYQSLGSHLRPVSPGTAPPNRSIFTIQPDAQPSAAPQPSPVHPPAAEPAAVTSFSRQQEVTSLGANATQTITTETETQDLGGVTVTKVTRQIALETCGVGATQEPAKRDGDAIVQRATIFHVPKIKAQPLRWQPCNASSAPAAERGRAVDRIVVNRPVTVDVTPIGGSGGREDVEPRVKPFTGVEPSREEQSRFKVPKTTAKPWVWQPSFVPGLPVRETSPAMAFHIIEASSAAAPYEHHLAMKKEERSRGGEGLGGRSSEDDLPPLSPDLIRVLTTEGPEDDWAAIARRRKIFADSSFYDDPEQKYPTIEEQIKMARKVALSLSAPDNVTARGQRMFMKRKEKAKNWTSDNPSYEGFVTLPKRRSPSGPRPPPRTTTPEPPHDLYYNPTPWKTPNLKKVEKVSLDLRKQLIEGYPEEALESFTKNRALFERGLGHQESDHLGHYDRSGRKVHPGGSQAPQALHGLSKDLKEMRGKGAKLFAQRRAKLAAEEAEEEEADQQGQGWHSEGEAGLVRERSQERAGLDYPDPSDVAAARRLEELISISKAYLTPWESTAGRQALKEPWHPVTQGPSTRSTSEPKTSEGSQPSFLGKGPSGGYRPVRFHVKSEVYSVPRVEVYSVPGVSEF